MRKKDAPHDKCRRGGIVLARDPTGSTGWSGAIFLTDFVAPVINRWATWRNSQQNTQSQTVKLTLYYLSPSLALFLRVIFSESVRLALSHKRNFGFSPPRPSRLVTPSMAPRQSGSESRTANGRAKRRSSTWGRLRRRRRRWSRGRAP